MSCEQRNIGPDTSASASDELAWRAFRYLHGELTDAEVEAFEEDLAIEQPAREALAHAARLTAVLEASADVHSTEFIATEFIATEFIATRPAQPPRSTFAALWRNRLSQPRVLLGTGIAACLAVAVTLVLMRGFGPQRPDHPGPTDQGDAQAALAKAWAVIGHDEEWQQVAASMPTMSAPDHDSVDDHDSADDANVDAGGNDHVAGDRVAGDQVLNLGWLLAALDPQAGETPEVMQ